MRVVWHGLGGGFAAALIAASWSSAWAQQQRVGTTGAVNPAAQSAPPGGSLRTMNVGGNVVFRERISTSDSGSVQLVFVDRTTMNIGPNSELTIDEFVYDPNGNTGRMTATLTKGVMRFVGGQASHTGGATIKTPATTLGVRGGVVTVSHNAQTGTRAINHFGILTAQTAGGQEVIRRPGFALNVSSNAQPPSPPAKAPQSEIDGNNRQLTSAQGQTGGRRQVPTDEGASRAVGENNSQVTTSTVSGQQQTTTQASQTTTNQPTTTATSDVLQTVQNTTTTGGQQQVVSTLPTVAPTVRRPDPPRRVYAMQGAAITGSLIPNAFLAGTPQESLVLGYGIGGKMPNGAPQTGSRIMMAGMVVNGAGVSQSSTLYGMWAGVYESQGEFIVDGGVRGTTRLSSTSAMGRLNTSMGSTPGSVTMDGDFSPLSATVNNNTFSETGARVAQSGFFYTGTGTSQNYTYTAQATRVATPPGLGAHRPTVDLYGVAAGLMRTSSDTLNVFNGPSFPVWGDTYITLTEAGRFSAVIDAFRLGAPTATADNFSDMLSLFGFLGEGTGARSTYVDYNNFLAAESADRATGQRLSIVNSNYVQNQYALMVTSQTVNAQSFFPGVNFCACEYSRWGFWSSDVQRAGLTPSATPDTVRDRLHMGTWVAGVPTTHVEVPTVGSATYMGHIIGSFKASGSEYIAAGNFQNTVNFGTNTGAVSISNLDGRSYSGTVLINTGDRTLLNGSANTISGPAATMNIGGAFMRGAAGPVGEMLGAFETTGTGYVGAGTFAAKQQ